MSGLGQKGCRGSGYLLSACVPVDVDDNKFCFERQHGMEIMGMCWVGQNYSLHHVMIWALLHGNDRLQALVLGIGIYTMGDAKVNLKITTAQA